MTGGMPYQALVIRGPAQMGDQPGLHRADNAHMGPYGTPDPTFNGGAMLRNDASRPMARRQL
jgi:hypothetical protein